MNKIVVQTATGSIYRINPGMKFYERLVQRVDSEKLVRASAGFYENIEWQTAPDGLRLALTCESKAEGEKPYRIISPPVRKVESA